MQFIHASVRTIFSAATLILLSLFFFVEKTNAQLFISQYIETNSGTTPKGIEIFNPTASNIVFSPTNNLQVYQGTNGGACNALPGTNITSGTLRAGEVWVIGTSDLTAYAISNGTDLSGTTDFGFAFNGNDALQLRLGGVLQDVFGTCGSDPGSAWSGSGVSTANQNIQTKTGICSGTTTYWTNPSLRFETVSTDPVNNMTGFGNAPVGCTSNSISTSAIAGSPFCVTASNGLAVNVPFTSSGTYNGGNIYTAQLSDVAGSFATPTDIGSLNSTANSGTINATIPAGTSGGSAYRIRVIASDPSTTGSDNGSNLTIVFSPQDVSGAGAISGNTTVDVVWTNPAACYDEILVVAKTGSITVTPSGDGSAYTANANFGAGTNLGSANYCVYKGTGNSITVTGLTNGMNYCFKIHTRSGTSWSSGVEVCAVPAATTVLAPGDIAVLGLNSNIAACVGGNAGDDEISFVCFQDITTNTAIEMTDNGWERINPGQWGNTEGVIQAVRTGGTIPAGTVITFRFFNGGTYTAISPDANWNITEIHTTGTDLIMNSGGDQIFFMQGGTWNYGTPGSHDAVLTNPNILFGFNTNDVWSADGTTQHSNPFPGLDCYSMMPGVATDYIKYTGVVDGFSAASQREWIRRINNPANWTSYADCFGYYADIPAYETGYSISINAGGFTDGLWLGTTDTDWFNCSNWESMRVPNQQINVVIPAAGVTNEPTIGDPTATNFTHAECNDIDLQNGRVLTLNHANSRLDLYGDISFNGNLSHTNGIIRLLGDASTYDASSVVSFYSLELNKNIAAQSFSINQDIIVNNTLT
ncbi:MAG TPA: lamin tail domain-containing protein [Bacteroidetes bacterium]|nr:lamin tail domain-containing protein [Bacteroidota bacterium]